MKGIARVIRLFGISVIGSAVVVCAILLFDTSFQVQASVNSDERSLYDMEVTTEYETEPEYDTSTETWLPEETEGVTETWVPEETERITETWVPEEAEEVTENFLSEETEGVTEAVVRKEEEATEAVYTEPVAGTALTDEQARVLALDNSDRYALLAREVFDLINQYRTENGISILAYDDALGYAAMHRSVENAWMNWFTTGVIDGKKHHIRPNNEKASTVFSVYGLTGTYAENMARYQATPEELIFGEFGWKNSASHNALMLDENCTRVGIGIAQDSEGYYYWVAVFSN